jgi:hypothetical protein
MLEEPWARGALCKRRAQGPTISALTRCVAPDQCGQGSTHRSLGPPGDGFEVPNGMVRLGYYLRLVCPPAPRPAWGHH